MSARAVALVAGERTRWPLAGDQLYVDLDLSEETLPAGMRLRVGEALVEVSAQPHTGCAKFAERFGREALRLVNTPVGRALRLARAERGRGRGRHRPARRRGPARRYLSFPIDFIE